MSYVRLVDGLQKDAEWAELFQIDSIEPALRPIYLQRQYEFALERFEDDVAVTFLLWLLNAISDTFLLPHLKFHPHYKQWELVSTGESNKAEKQAKTARVETALAFLATLPQVRIVQVQPRERGEKPHDSKIPVFEKIRRVLLNEIRSSGSVDVLVRCYPLYLALERDEDRKMFCELLEALAPSDARLAENTLFGLLSDDPEKWDIDPFVRMVYYAWVRAARPRERLYRMWATAALLPAPCKELWREPECRTRPFRILRELFAEQAVVLDAQASALEEAMPRDQWNAAMVQVIDPTTLQLVMTTEYVKPPFMKPEEAAVWSFPEADGYRLYFSLMAKVSEWLAAESSRSRFTVQLEYRVVERYGRSLGDTVYFKKSEDVVLKKADARRRS